MCGDSPFPYTSDLHWLHAWASRIEAWDKPTNKHTCILFLPDVTATDALMRLGDLSPAALTGIQDALARTEKAFGVFLQDDSVANDEAVGELMWELARRIRIAIEIFEEELAKKSRDMESSSTRIETEPQGRLDSDQTYVFRKKGKTWEFRFGDEQQTDPRDLVGYWYIRYLLEAPNQPISPNKLVERYRGRMNAIPVDDKAGFLDDKGIRAEGLSPQEAMDRLEIDQLEAAQNAAREKAESAQRRGDLDAFEEANDEREQIIAHIQKNIQTGEKGRVLRDKDGNILSRKIQDKTESNARSVRDAIKLAKEKIKDLALTNMSHHLDRIKFKNGKWTYSLSTDEAKRIQWQVWQR